MVKNIITILQKNMNMNWGILNVEMSYLKKKDWQS